MSAKATGRRRSSVKEKSEKGSIKDFFGKKPAAAAPENAAEAGDSEVSSVRSSPDKTSDYESETSRSNTPVVASISPRQEDSGATQAPSTMPIKREVTKVEDEEEDQGADLFNATADAEDIDDKAGVKAAVMSGLLSAGVKDEEDRMAEETARMERQEEVKRKQLLAKEAEELNITQRYERLQKLLGKSKFYTDFLLNKMKGHEAAMELKKQTNEARAKKRAEKEAASSSVEKRRTGRNKDDEEVAPKQSAKRGRKSKADEEPSSKKRKTEEVVEDQEDVKKNRNEKNRQFEGRDIPNNQPLLLTGGIMRDYQLEGYEWMSTLWENGINGILADEMGLGKTIQTVALFCHMYEMGVSGPFLVVAPLSTVPNWVNEFKRFAPKVPCILYHGNMQERLELREKLTDVTTCEEMDGKDMMNVVVTSYEIAMNDRAAFSSIMWRYIVVDEGHRLKNMNCRLIKELKQYHSANRLLLTGTPLQNNLSELWSLLNFLLPEIFDDLRVFQSWFDAKDLHEDKEEQARVVAQEQQNSILTTLHQILTPFLLRRVKTDVDLQIPPKKEVMVYCPMTERQEEMYRNVVERTIDSYVDKDEEKKVEILPEKRKRTTVDYSAFLDEREFDNNDDKFEEHLVKLQEYRESLMNTASAKSAYTREMDRLGKNEINFCMKNAMMDMRKAVNHPYLIEYPVTEDGMFYDSGPDLIDICGKMAVLDQMVEQLLKDGHKILIFSQMTKMLDILGDYLNMKKWKFSRLDGSMNFLDRQANIDKFNTDPEQCIFLLSTRAGGLGINLTAADTCIIYDSDWNPQQDLQAQDRCHRIGQTKPVMIYRLVTANTFDQRIVERAAAKRKLEKMIIHRSKFKAGAESVSSSLQSISPQELLALLDSKDYCGSVSAGTDGQVFTEEQMNHLLDRSDLAWGANPHNPVNMKNDKKAVSGMEGVFKVIDQDTNKGDLGSVKE